MRDYEGREKKFTAEAQRAQRMKDAKKWKEIDVIFDGCEFPKSHFS